MSNNLIVYELQCDNVAQLLPTSSLHAWELYSQDQHSECEDHRPDEHLGQFLCMCVLEGFYEYVCIIMWVYES
jgi:hypothetical protein